MAHPADAEDSLDLSARLHPADGRLLQLELARRPSLQLLELQAPPHPHACTPARLHACTPACLHHTRGAAAARVQLLVWSSCRSCSCTTLAHPRCSCTAVPARSAHLHAPHTCTLRTPPAALPRHGCTSSQTPCPHCHHRHPQGNGLGCAGVEALVQALRYVETKARQGSASAPSGGLAEAGRSSGQPEPRYGYALALTGASGAPAGRRLSRLALHIGAAPAGLCRAAALPRAGGQWHRRGRRLQPRRLARRGRRAAPDDRAAGQQVS